MATLKMPKDMNKSKTLKHAEEASAWMSIARL
jgi:hypothetical protein